MGSIYIGGQKNSKKGKWKLYLFLVLFLGVIGSALRVSGPTIVEEWINRNGTGKNGYAFSIRDVDLSLAKGEITLTDVKVFNPRTDTELLEAPNLTIQLNWSELILSQERNVAINADKVDLILSEDFSSEIERIHSSDKKNNTYYLDAVEGKIGKLNIIEKKDDQSRTMLELNDVNLKVKEISPLSINKKTEFSVSSKVSVGGKLNLSGKTSEENGRTPWSIQGSLKQVPADIFDKIAGDKLPFSFYQPSLNAEITARSDHGKVSGEISPDIDRLNLLQERAGNSTQSIKRLLNEDLTFTLPFTLKDELTLQYADVYDKLKTYRRSPAVSEDKKSKSFWIF